MQIFVKSGVFFVSYVLVMIPTYLLPYLGSNSAVMQSVGAVSRENQMGGGVVGGLFLAHLGCLAFLTFITWVKGKSGGKGWIAVFPAVALIFDLTPVLNLIPLIPTVMHVCALVLGVRSAPLPPVVTAAQATASRDLN